MATRFPKDSIVPAVIGPSAATVLRSKTDFRLFPPRIFAKLVTVEELVKTTIWRLPDDAPDHSFVHFRENILVTGQDVDARSGGFERPGQYVAGLFCARQQDAAADKFFQPAVRVR